MIGTMVLVLMGCGSAVFAGSMAGTRTLASVASDRGIYPLGALGRADPPAPLYAAGQAPPSASAEGTPAPCRGYRAEHLYGAGA